MSIDMDGVVFDYAKVMDMGHKEGDTRLWVDGRCIAGPIVLRSQKPLEDTESFSACVWECESLLHQKIVEVPEFDIGRTLTSEEVLAWMAV